MLLYSSHSTGWLDHGVPEPREFLDLLSALTLIRSNLNNGDCGPTLVHCSAGIGRTGVLLMLAVVEDMISSELLPDIPNMLLVNIFVFISSLGVIVVLVTLFLSRLNINFL